MITVRLKVIVTRIGKTKREIKNKKRNQQWHEFFHLATTLNEGIDIIDP